MTATDLPSIDDELEAVLAGPDPDYEAEPTAPEDDEHAERLLRHLRRARAEADRILATGQAEIDRINAWVAERQRPLVDRMAWLEASLGQFLRARLERGMDGKTLHLPSGTISARAQQDAWSYDDEAALLAWLQDHAPDAVRIPEPKPAIDKTAVKQLLIVPSLDVGESAPPVTEDGEVVPGVTVTRRGDTYQVTLDDGGTSS